MSELIIIGGMPASGKSTASKIIARKTNSILIDKDLVNPYESEMSSWLAEGENDRDSDSYKKGVYPFTLDAIKRQVNWWAKNNRSIVVDAPYLTLARQALASEKTLFQAIEEELSRKPTTILWFTVSAQLQKDRMISRGASRDNPKLANFESYRNTIDFALDLPKSFYTKNFHDWNGERIDY